MELAECKPLATWKTWWSPSLARAIARTLHETIDPRLLPGGGQLLTKDYFRTQDLNDAHVSLVIEGLLKSYPKDRQPSGYLLGDAFMALDLIMNHSLLGPPQSNPIKEKHRRESGLAEGGKMRKLLSFVRTSSLKHDVGKTAESTFIKKMANNRIVRGKSKTFSSPSISNSSQCSPSSPVDPSPVQLGIEIGVHFPFQILGCLGSVVYQPENCSFIEQRYESFPKPVQSG